VPPSVVLLNVSREVGLFVLPAHTREVSKSEQLADHDRIRRSAGPNIPAFLMSGCGGGGVAASDGRHFEK
jgi:hypothetical protein